MTMKINIKYAALSLMAVAGISTVTSCSDDESYDVYGSNNNFIYIAPQDYSKGFNCEVLTTPAGVYGQVGATMKVQVQLPTKDTVKVSAEVKATQDLVDAYNSEHGTDYVLPSQDILSGMKVLSSSGVGANKKTSAAGDEIKVQLDASKIDLFRVDDAENAPTYVIPVSLKFDGAEGPGTDRPFVISQQQGIAYIVVKTSKADNFSSISGNTVIKNTIAKTPAGVYGGISAEVKFKNLIGITGDMQGTLVADNSLVATYNAKYSANCQALPSNILSALTVTPATVSEGETETATGIKVSVPEELTKNLEGSYVLPLRLKTTFANGVSVDEDDVVYIVVEVKTQLVNDSPSSIIGTMADASTFTAVEAENMNVAKYGDMFAGGWSARWPFTTKGSKASFVVDIKDTKAITGFGCDAYAVNSYTVSVSTDKTNWTELGNSAEHKAMRDDDYNNIYVLYGGVNCRYVKFEFNLNEGDWSWDYGWAGMSGLFLYFQ